MRQARGVLLLFNHPDRYDQNIVELARQAGIGLRRISCWEQVDEITQDMSGTDAWSFGGRPMAAGTRMLFIDYPAFACPPIGDAALVQFGAAEWQASLTAFLWQRRRDVLNGAWLIGRPWIQRNRALLLPPLWRLGWARLSAARAGTGETLWLLLADWSCRSFPLQETGFPSSQGRGAVLRDTFLLMKERSLDCLVLRLDVSWQAVALTEAHLIPTPEMPATLVSAMLEDLAWRQGGE